jgi:1-phosphofructokinase family hexose kinase
MLLCVSLAPSLDRYLRVPALRLGTVNRPDDVVERAGGKGLNVARAARGVGLSTRVLVLLGGEVGSAVARLAGAEGLDVRVVEDGASTRQCYCVLDESTNQVTELYEPVAAVDPASTAAVVRAFDEEIEGLHAGDVVALSGQVPLGVDPTIYSSMTSRAHEADLVVVVDSDGEALEQVLGAAPDVVKVNLAEARRVTAGSESTVAPGVARALHGRTSRQVIVTLGAAGSVGIATDGTSHAMAPEPIVGAYPVGSGDAYVAGMAVELLRSQRDLEALMRAGSAAARVNARSFLAGSLDEESWRREVESLRASPGLA